MSKYSFDESFIEYYKKLHEISQIYKICQWCHEKIESNDIVNSDSNDIINSDSNDIVNSDSNDVFDPKNYHPKCYDASNTFDKMNDMKEKCMDFFKQKSNYPPYEDKIKNFKKSQII